MREIEEEWSGFMHEHEFPIKALTCTGKTTPQGLSDYGFINTTNILQVSKERTNSRSDTVEEKSGKENNDVPLYSSTPKSVGQTRNQSSRSDSSAVNDLLKTTNLEQKTVKRSAKLLY